MCSYAYVLLRPAISSDAEDATILGVFSEREKAIEHASALGATSVRVQQVEMNVLLLDGRSDTTTVLEDGDDALTMLREHQDAARRRRATDVREQLQRCLDVISNSCADSWAVMEDQRRAIRQIMAGNAGVQRDLPRELMARVKDAVNDVW